VFVKRSDKTAEGGTCARIRLRLRTGQKAFLWLQSAATKLPTAAATLFASSLKINCTKRFFVFAGVSALQRRYGSFVKFAAAALFARLQLPQTYLHCNVVLQ